MEQTAVEWLVDELLSGKTLMPSLIQQAKEMEKKQMYSKGDYCAVCGSREFFNDEEE